MTARTHNDGAALAGETYRRLVGYLVLLRRQAERFIAMETIGGADVFNGLIDVAEKIEAEVAAAVAQIGAPRLAAIAKAEAADPDYDVIAEWQAIRAALAALAAEAKAELAGKSAVDYDQQGRMAQVVVSTVTRDKLRARLAALRDLIEPLA